MQHLYACTVLYLRLSLISGHRDTHTHLLSLSSYRVDVCAGNTDNLNHRNWLWNTPVQIIGTCSDCAFAYLEIQNCKIIVILLKHIDDITQLISVSDVN